MKARVSCKSNYVISRVILQGRIHGHPCYGGACLGFGFLYKIRQSHWSNATSQKINLLYCPPPSLQVAPLLLTAPSATAPHAPTNPPAALKPKDPRSAARAVRVMSHAKFALWGTGAYAEVRPMTNKTDAHAELGPMQNLSLCRFQLRWQSINADDPAQICV